MQITIGENEKDQRFDRFLRKYFKPNTEIKLADIYSRIRKGIIKINGQKAKENYKLCKDDVIDVDVSKLSDKDPLAALVSKQTKMKNIDVGQVRKLILYEDENRIFVNKPADLVVHPGNKHNNDLTLNDYLAAYCEQTMNIQSQTFKPAFGFRLDKDTSGIIVAAKNYEALQYLNKLIRNRQTSKTYLAIVAGKFPDKKIDIKEPLFRGFNKKFGRAQSFVNKELGVQAKTQAWLLNHKKDKYLGDISLVQVKLYTGRMHQIRVHISHIGHSILGDIMYGDNALNRILSSKYMITRQLLHSYEYGFNDKFTKKDIFVKVPCPNDFNKLFGPTKNEKSDTELRI